MSTGRTFCKAIALLFLIALLSCKSESQKDKIVLSNSMNIKRLNEAVHLKMDKFNISYKNGFSLIKDADNSTIPYQLIDSDKDGISDEILLLCDFQANESKSIRIVQSDKKPSIEQFANVYFSLKSQTDKPSPRITDTTKTMGFVQDISNPVFQMEGPGFENDKVAFRTFFDARNGKDIYGKTVDTMVLDYVGIGPSWHHLQPWGMDILHVGKSLGAGGLGVVEKDTLYSLSDADLTKYHEISRGPIEASINLEFTGWDAGTKKINGYEKLSISKDKFYYENEIFVSDTSIILAVGLPGFVCEKPDFSKHNDNFYSISTYGDQAADTNTKLGMAILFNSDQYLGHEYVEDNGKIQKTHYVKLKAKDINRIYFFACWELTNPLFSEKSNFMEYLQNEADKLSNPIKIN